jgi:hypothetical protein
MDGYNYMILISLYETDGEDNTAFYKIRKDYLENKLIKFCIILYWWLFQKIIQQNLY